MKFLIRRLQHRTNNDEQKTSERYVINTTYKSEYDNKMLLYPVPEFIEDKKCMCPSCTNIGEFMSDKYFIFCGKCLNNQFENSVLTQEKVLIVPSVDQAVRGNAFEWQVEGKDDWYKVRGMNISWDSTQRLSVLEIKKRWDEIMYQVLTDNPQLVEGEYNKDERKLIILV